MNLETAQPGARRSAAARRAVWRLLLLGLTLLLAGAAWFGWGYLYSGRLALAQPAPSTDIPRGFDFGPVWLEQGQAGRYFISALVPETQGAPWYTTFEILDARKQPVQRQDELRYIGDYQFASGERETYSGAFTLNQDTGYYFFRFSAKNGAYAAQAAGPPVLEFSLRQRVLAGYALWLPAIGAALLGLACFIFAAQLIGRLGTKQSVDPVSQQPAEWAGQGARG